MINLSIDFIRSFFSSFHREEINDPNFVRAGVLVPLFERNGICHVVFTQRTNEVEHHKGQISFPGGRMDKTDATIIDTALREAEEEIGLPRNTVEVLGVLDDFLTPSGFCITPVVGFFLSIVPFPINRIEVSEIFDAPLMFFLDPHNERKEQHMRASKLIDVFFYNYGKYEIWGATAMMLRTFLYALIEYKKTL